LFISIAGLFDALLDAVQLLLQGRGFTSPDEHGLEVANRWRAATVAKCARTNEFEGSGTQAVIGHQDSRDIRCDKASGKFEASLKCVLGGVKIEDHDIAAGCGREDIRLVSIWLQQDLKVLTKGRR